MLLHQRPGMFVWGGILAIIGIVFMITGGAGFYVGIPFVIGGALLIIFGVRRTIKVNETNAALMAQGAYMKGQCYKCGLDVSVERKLFQPHRNFPDGFIYCPSCKIPLSILKFTPSQTP